MYSSLFSPNSIVRNVPWTLPFGYQACLWPSGFGNPDTTDGPGFMGILPAGFINANAAAITSPQGYDITSFFGPIPLVFPYGASRNIVVTVKDSSYNTAGLILKINGIANDGFNPVQTTFNPIDIHSNPSTQIYKYITSMVLSGTLTAPVTSDLYLDWGCFGYTYPFIPAMVCSSWNASLQVTVPSTSTIKYTVMNDNFPRNVQSNTTPGQNVQFYGAFAGMDNPATAFEMVNTLQAAPYPNLADQEASILVPIPFPVGNTYLKIDPTDTDETGTLMAIFLQAGRDQ